MTRTQLLYAARQRDIDSSRIDARLQLGCRQVPLAFFEGLLYRLASFVHGLAHRGTRLFLHLAHVAQVRRERTGLADHAHAHFVEGRGVDRPLDCGERFLAQGLQFFNNCHVLPFDMHFHTNAQYSRSNARRPAERSAFTNNQVIHTLDSAWSIAMNCPRAKTDLVGSCKSRRAGIVRGKLPAWESSLTGCFRSCGRYLAVR